MHLICLNQQRDVVSKVHHIWKRPRSPFGTYVNSLTWVPLASPWPQSFRLQDRQSFNINFLPRVAPLGRGQRWTTALMWTWSCSWAASPASKTRQTTANLSSTSSRRDWPSTAGAWPTASPWSHGKRPPGSPARCPSRSSSGRTVKPLEWMCSQPMMLWVKTIMVWGPRN